MSVKAFERSALYEDSQRLLEWEDENGVRLGRNVQLHPGSPFIPGTTLGELTGGIGNIVRVTLQQPTPVPLIADLTDGQWGVTYICDDGIPSNPSLDTLTSGTENLTIGIAGADSNNRLGDLTAGSIHIVIICTDLTTLTFDVSASDIVALSTAQGMQYDRFNTIDISTIQSLVSIEGKTIDTVTYAVTPGFTAATPGLASGGSSSQYTLLINGVSIGCTPHGMGDGMGGSDGPGLGYVVPAGAILNLQVYLISDSTPFNVITSLTAAKLAAAAIDQSQGGIATGQIYLCTSPTITPIVDISKLINRTIASMAVSAASPLWASTSQPIVNASSSFDFYYLEYLRLHTDLTATPFSNTMTDSFGINDDISIVFTLVPGLGGPTVVTLLLSLFDLKNNAALVSPGVYSIDLNSSLAWDVSLVPLQGKHIVQIQTFIITAYTDGSTIDLSLTGSSIRLIETRYQVQGWQDQYDLGTYQANVVTNVDIYWDEFWVSTMMLNLVPIVPSPIDIDFPIDAATIKSLATTQALGQPSWIDCFQTYGGTFGDIKWPFLLAPWIGSTVVDTVLIGGLTDYGPAPFDGTAFLAFGWTDLTYQSVPPDIETLASTMVLTGYHMSGVITANTTMLLQGPYSWRIGTNHPGTPELLSAYTEPQCIRNRSRHSIIIVGDKNYQPGEGGYNKTAFWREYSHDGVHWVNIDKYLPINLMSLQPMSGFILGGQMYPDWLDIEATVFRGVYSYTDGRRWWNETFEWVRFGISLVSEEGELGPGPPIFATVMARE